MNSGARHSASGIESLAIIALGSNQGDSPALLRAGMDRLQTFSDAPLLRSSLWQSTPVNCPPGSPAFVNAVVALAPRADETPESLLPRLQALEREFGRRPKVVLNEPRPLDLDLITYGREQRDRPDLTVPHPRAHLRRFVLEPLAEIAPDLRAPGWPGTVSDLLQRLETSETLVRMAG